MRYIIIIKFKNNAELVYRVKEEDLKVAVNKALWELNQTQYPNVVNIQVIQEIEFKEI